MTSKSGATLFVVAVLATGFAAPRAHAANSLCFAIAQALPGAQYVSLAPVAMELPIVTIEYAGHSTFRITSQGGVTIATDYSGYAGVGDPPDVVTMNRAHTSHFTDLPDPRIANVLRGWAEGGGPAKHQLQLDDVLIRNVPTDIRQLGAIVPFGNSIFIFEIAGLCIGHLGHLHHMPTEDHYAAIGRLDVVMVPVDGTHTMDVNAMIQVLDRLRARIVLPMHYFGEGTLGRFLAGLQATYDIRFPKERKLTLTIRDLPAK
ncbi:MAG: MBL fold metallo-hydrolase, partial [Alphaproteobacteria bacterium]